MGEREAFCDESMRVREGATGIYVLAAAVFATDQLDNIRDVLRPLGRRSGRFHWRDETPASRLHAADVVASVPALHTVVVSTTMRASRQERARALCLERLLWLLERDDVLAVALETRTTSLNRADVVTLSRLRARRIISPRGLRIQHLQPSKEPLLWAADIIAGACREVHDGQHQYQRALSDVVMVEAIP
jgi:hypothetical protein